MMAYRHLVLAAELNRFSRYADALIALPFLEHDKGEVFQAVQGKGKRALESMTNLEVEHEEARNLYLLNGHFNHSSNIQDLLESLKPSLSRHSRLAVIAYNPYLRWLYQLVAWLGLRRGEIPKTFLTRTDLDHIAALAGYQVIKQRQCVFMPFYIPLVSWLLNRFLPVVPGLKHLSLVTLLVLRPTRPTSCGKLSIVVPARNEAGNLHGLLQRLPDFGDRSVEVLFVEGNSSDDTWQEMQALATDYHGPHTVRCFQQAGRGKNDAVRKGFAEATGDLLVILDADLTVAPERLLDFVRAYEMGLGDFVNGNRLLYPMEKDAMRFLNTLGNRFFAKALKWILQIPIGDSLCGTKLFARRDYERMLEWRGDFGDFDPFGDFEFLFAASELNLGVVDIPLQYRARTYGDTNISRFRHGLQLLRMTLIGLWHIAFGQVTSVGPVGEAGRGPDETSRAKP